MARTRSRQSRVLRRRLTVHLLIMLVVYSLLFAIAVSLANTYLVPKIARYVEDTTTSYRYFYPADYVNAQSILSMVDEERQMYADEGFETVFITEYTTEELEGLRQQWLANAQNSTDSAVHTPIYIGRMYIADTTDNPQYPDNYSSFQDYSIDSLAYSAALRYLHSLQTDSDRWEIDPLAGSGKYGPFVARELSAYYSLRAFKIPLAVCLYAIGCIIIVFVEIRRSLNYFDELSNAVTGLMINKSEPVKLPKNLSIAQDELNAIRTEALNDEKVAKSAEQRKNELVAYLAHDIRTPLTSVIGYLSFLDEAGDLPPELRKKYTHIAFEKSESLQTLINEFFEITRFNLEDRSLKRSDVDVKLFLEQIADVFYPQACAKHIAIVVEAPGNQTFSVDADKFARACENILRNAVTFAHAYTAIKVCATHVDTERGSWEITIANEGDEIAADHLDSIFEKFYREDKARNSASGGAGLGLAIAKEIVLAHDGSISATSVDGQTVFTIVI